MQAQAPIFNSFSPLNWILNNCNYYFLSSMCLIQFHNPQLWIFHFLIKISALDSTDLILWICFLGKKNKGIQTKTKIVKNGKIYTFYTFQRLRMETEIY